jgi:hypothetical protein
VPDLHAGDRPARQDPTVINAASADSRAGKDADHRTGSLSGSEAVLTVDAGIDIVHDFHVAVEFIMEHFF